MRRRPSEGSARRFRAAGKVFRHPAAAARDGIDRAVLKNSTLAGRLPARIPPGSHGPRLVMGVEAGGRPVSISRAITDRLQEIPRNGPRLASALLRRHVLERAYQDAGIRFATAVHQSRDRQRLGNPEVQHLGHRALTSLRKKMFSGLRSRWMRPRRWAAETAEQTSPSIGSARPGEK